MVEKEVTTMVIKVINLGCEKCAKKIKKVLCQIPEIQNQVYDKKTNTVTITVVCCSPEKIKQKICCKGGETITGIEIKVPKPTPEPPVTQPAPPRIAIVPVYPLWTCCRECSEGVHGGPCFHGCGTPAPPPCYGPPYARPVCVSWGVGGCDCQRCGYYVCRCEYVCDDNRSSCITM